jgi:hypothetical protein
MVIVKQYHLREGEESDYITLELEGDLELVQSQNTGRFYATTRRCRIYSTFDEATAMRMLGSEMPGKIVRVPCDPYVYTIPETGQEIQLGHTWDYVPDDTPTPTSITRLKKTDLPVGIVEYTRP